MDPAFPGAEHPRRPRAPHLRLLDDDAQRPQHQLRAVQRRARGRRVGRVGKGDEAVAAAGLGARGVRRRVEHGDGVLDRVCLREELRQVVRGRGRGEVAHEERAWVVSVRGGLTRWESGQRSGKAFFASSLGGPWPGRL